MNLKDAAPLYEIHPLIRRRWSPRAFGDAPVTARHMASLLEAARWAPSCLNEQPWRFVVARREEEQAFAHLVGCLTPANQVWAARAGALIFTLAGDNFSKTREHNRYAWHDIGLATSQLITQAMAMGLQVHPMAGFDVDATREALEVPDSFTPVSALAVGYPGDPDSLPLELAVRERAPRSRRPMSESASAGIFGHPLPPVEDRRALEVLSFWFGMVDELGQSPDDRAARWWKKDPEFDAALRDRFGELHESITEGELEGWLDSARERLAYIIVLDQFSRNMFRDTGDMFAQDHQAVAAALGGIKRGMDRALPTDLRAFYYLPLMHSEELEHQDLCVELFAALARELPEEGRARITSNLKFARMHRDIVARFGRFPHRNELLGRDTTEEEAEFLKGPGSSF